MNFRFSQVAGRVLLGRAQRLACARDEADEITRPALAILDPGIELREAKAGISSSTTCRRHDRDAAQFPG
jgi:hypothetical protein